MQTPIGHDKPPRIAPGTPLDPPVHILVVDDDESNRESLGRRLTRHGYTVITASDGQSALDLIERQVFHLVLLDVMMPGISGLEVLGRVRQRLSSSDLPIIMATARDLSEDIVAALDSGANDYVTKPLDFAVVLARVRTQVLLKQSVDRATELERKLSVRNQDLEVANAKLELHSRRTAHELEAAARVQKAFLPPPSLEMPGCSFAWVFDPCQQLAGDSLNILQLDSEHVAFYVLDVSGHGVAASLLAVAATRLLSAVGNEDSFILQSRDGVMIPAAPSLVATALNKRFAWNSATTQFITLFYAVLNIRNQMLTYVSAGHPGAILIVRGKEPCTLEGSGFPIGVGDVYEEHAVRLERGDRVYLYSDGVTEAMNPLEEMFGSERLMTALNRGLDKSLSESVAALQAEIVEWLGGEASKDDISVLAVECR